MGSLGPPDKFEDISIIPTFASILSKKRAFLRPNKTTGAFANPRDYIDIHFRLFYEDFLRPFQTGVQDFILFQKEYLSGKKDVPRGNIRLYKDVIYDTPFDPKKAKSPYQYVQLKPKYYFDVDWEESKQFLPGSMLLLSCDNFVTAYVALVQDFRNEDLLNRGILGIHWIDEPPSFKRRYNFTILESEAFFQSYRYTLKVLQDLEPESLPLLKYIVHGCSTVGPPQYLTTFNKTIKLGGKEVVPLNSKTWPEPEDLRLNQNQFNALKSCLTNEFAIVQGPPGTGKTFLALQVVETLLRNIDMWNPKGKKAAPILIVCYTNHALDQFLEGILKIFQKIGVEPNLLRVGGGGESEILFKYNISLKPQKMRKSAVLNSLVVGMTTTGAAKHSHLLVHASPRIVIVEEAAEVLEAHIIPCLLPKCEHLVLIGDHQQLQPSINVHELSDVYNLDISLFERMVNNKLHLCTLNVQHRMRPAISNLVTGTIYKDLKNANNVLQYPKVLGTKSHLYFVKHEQNESPIPGSASKVNNYEANFIVAMCCYMVKQGYSPSQITILATYKGQVDLIKLRVRNHELTEEVEVTTVDGFQGKENDIILLSLVRSNDEAKIGFLKKDNRICVALSRAKLGLFIIGNMTQLMSRSKTWRQIQKKLAKESAIGPYLPIQCQIHGKIQNIHHPENFQRLAPEGGCTRPCEQKLVCGHKCQSICHKKDHEDYKCQFRCAKSCIRGHPCPVLCYEPCPPCTVMCKSNLPCSHKVPVPCFLAENEESTKKSLKFCLQRCNYTFPKKDGGCGHRCQGTCTSCLQGRLHVKCEAKCEKILPCGHQCEFLCFQDCSCQRKCRIQCEHLECTGLCGDVCDTCVEPCPWACEHKSCSKLCSEVCDRDPCDEPCLKILKCGHSCLGFCGEPCPTQCRHCNTNGLYRNSSLEVNILCVSERYVLLEECGHAIEHRTLEVHLNSVFSPLLCPVPICKTEITRCHRFKYKLKINQGKNRNWKQVIMKAIAAQNDVNHKDVTSFINDNDEVDKYFPYVVFFIQMKLSDMIVSAQQKHTTTKGLSSLRVLKEFLQIAVRIVTFDDDLLKKSFRTDLVDRFYSFFYTLMRRQFPWTKEELKNCEREFLRLWHLAQTFYLATLSLSSCGHITRTQCKKIFDELYISLGAKSMFSTKAQTHVQSHYKELAKFLPDDTVGLDLAKWIDKPVNIVGDWYHDYNEITQEAF